MIKKNIGKILTTGSARQKILLIAEDNARQIYGEERLLTDKDFKTISNSFKKPNELKLWNEFRRYGESVNNGIMNLQGMKYDLLMNKSNLRGYILLWNSIENTEALVNSILDEINPIEERIRIANKHKKAGHFLFTRGSVDPEGYLNISTDFIKEKSKLLKEVSKQEGDNVINLITIINNVREGLITSAIKYISWEKGLLDFMEERGFNIKTYKDKIKQMTKEVYEPTIQWHKYSGTNIFDSSPHYGKLLEKYNVDPKLWELEVDEKQVHFFRYEIIGDNEQ